MTASEIDESIAASRQTFVDALRRGDARGAASVYAENAHLLAPSSDAISGRDEIRAYWQAGIDAGVAEMSLTASGTDQNDGLAYETGRYVIRVDGSDTAHAIERGHYVQVYQRQADGSWQRAVEIFSPGGGE